MTIKQFGRGCIREDKQLKLNAMDSEESCVRDDEPCGTCRYCFVNDESQKQFCEDAYSHARKVLSGDYGLVILDELVYAVTYGMLPLEKALELIALKPAHVELVITGGAWQGEVPQELLEPNRETVTAVGRCADSQNGGIRRKSGVIPQPADLPRRAVLKQMLPDRLRGPLRHRRPLP